MKQYGYVIDNIINTYTIIEYVKHSKQYIFITIDMEKVIDISQLDFMVW